MSLVIRRSGGHEVVKDVTGFEGYGPAYPSHHLAPELLARQLGTISHCLELGPGNRGGDSVPIRTGAEAAVRTRNHVLAAHDAGIVHDAVRHQLRMLNEVGLCIYHASDHDHAIWELHIPEH